MSDDNGNGEVIIGQEGKETQSEERLIFKCYLRDNQMFTVFGDKIPFKDIAFAIKLLDMRFENMVLASQQQAVVPVKPKGQTLTPGFLDKIRRMR